MDAADRPRGLDGQECGWCRYWLQRENETGQDGWCRRRAPVGQMIAALPAEDVDWDEHSDRMYAVWPLTNWIDWCGDFEGVKFDDDPPATPPPESQIKNP